MQQKHKGATWTEVTKRRKESGAQKRLKRSFPFATREKKGRTLRKTSPNAEKKLGGRKLSVRVTCPSLKVRGGFENSRRKVYRGADGISYRANLRRKGNADQERGLLKRRGGGDLREEKIRPKSLKVRMSPEGEKSVPSAAMSKEIPGSGSSEKKTLKPSKKIPFLRRRSRPAAGPL